MQHVDVIKLLDLGLGAADGQATSWAYLGNARWANVPFGLWAASAKIVWKMARPAWKWPPWFYDPVQSIAIGHDELVSCEHIPSTGLLHHLYTPAMSVSRNVSQVGVTKQCWVTIRKLMTCTCRPHIKTRLLFPSPTTKISRIQRFIIQLFAQDYKKPSCCCERTTYVGVAADRCLG